MRDVYSADTDMLASEETSCEIDAVISSCKAMEVVRVEVGDAIEFMVFPLDDGIGISEKMLEDVNSDWESGCGSEFV